MSGSNNLLTALLAFQKNAPTLARDSTNPHFKNRYVSLDSIMQTVTPLLSDQGLLWIALPCIENGEPALRYRLVHAESGEVIEGVMPLMLAKADSQGQGSALTYARRYAISAVLGLSAEDDDGNKAGGDKRASAPGRPQEAPQPVSRPRVDPDSLDALRRRFKDTGWTPETLAMQLTAVGAGDVSDVRAAMQALSPEQARQLLSAMNSAVDEQVTADEVLQELRRQVAG